MNDTTTKQTSVSETPGQDRIAELRISHPGVSIQVSRKLDPYFKWDGDGPDPTAEGFRPYTVTVSATSIFAGRTVQGTNSLGGSYYRPDEPVGEINGYLPQMIDEALSELDDEILSIALESAAEFGRAALESVRSGDIQSAATKARIAWHFAHIYLRHHAAAAGTGCTKVCGRRSGVAEDANHD